jgi:transglutaminase-like putative cysteine protease
MKHSRRARFRTLGMALGGVSALTVALSAAAQVIGSRPVLHLDLPPPDEAEDIAINRRQPLFGPEPGEGRNPSAFGYRNKILPAPQTGPQPLESEPVYGRDVTMDRHTQTKPDNKTGTDNTLQYSEPFNPSVLPFKRMSAFDSVGSDFTMFVANPDALQDLPVGGAPTPDRDLFWADLVVELSPGRDVPIPSVAPDMRIVSYEIDPRLQVTFSKDGADNYFVRSDENEASGTYRLRFMADAAATYFAPQVPSNLRVSDVRDRVPEGLLKPLPDSLRPSVAEALARLNIDDRLPLRRALDLLVAHFRAFEAEYLSQTPDGNLYLDLVEQQVGVCRHRAFAFMVTANGLGIPTRYVTNEAHAWVEVWLPDNNWARIDLGGAALRMVVDNAENKAMYQPRREDPFAKPPNYQNNYTQLEGEIAGLTQEQKDEVRNPTPMEGNGGFQPGPPGAPGSSRSGQISPEDDPRNVFIGPGTELPTLPGEMMQNKRPTRLELTYVDPEGFRGESISVTGRLTSDGKGVGGQSIEIYLAPEGRDGNDARLVDRTVTEGDGAFTVYVAIPAELELRGYEVYAATRGDSRFSPALSR